MFHFIYLFIYFFFFFVKKWIYLILVFMKDDCYKFYFWQIFAEYLLVICAFFFSSACFHRVGRFLLKTILTFCIFVRER